MSAYWVDYVRLMIPGFLLTAASALPLAIATAVAAAHLGWRNPGPYRRNLWASTAAGIVALGLLFDAFFGEGLKGSTAGLIFLFVPIYSAAALGMGYGLGALAHRRASHATEATLSKIERRFIVVPGIMLVALLIGMLKHSIQHNDLTVAGQATNLETIRSIHQKSRSGLADSFSVPHFLAQNPNTPTDVLEELSKHEHISVRIFVVRHSNTSKTAIERMVSDCDARIQDEARARLQLASASSSVPQPAPNCPRG